MAGKLIIAVDGTEDGFYTVCINRNMCLAKMRKRLDVKEHRMRDKKTWQFLIQKATVCVCLLIQTVESLLGIERYKHRGRLSKKIRD